MQPLDSFASSQEHHFLRWNGDIADILLLVALEGKESLSSPFVYKLRSLTRKNEKDLNHWHGKAVSCTIGEDGTPHPRRVLHGVVTRIDYKQCTQNEAECVLTLEPSLALLAKAQTMRVWQNISVPELVSTLLSEHDISQQENRLYGDYPPREYCIQFRESVFEFIQRLLGEEGIYYFFQHCESGHTFVLADHPACHPSIQGNTLLWHHSDSILSEGNIDRWCSSVSLLPASVTLQGINMPQATAIDDKQNAGESYACVDSITFSDITPLDERSHITRKAKKLIQAHEANTHFFDAEVNAYWLCSGETFTLNGHPSGDKFYRIQSLQFSGVNNFDSNGSSYNCQLQVMNGEKPWYPPYPESPEIAGMLPATVVGPASEDIHTDKYGRIKIHFPWDKKNPYDDTSSCWVRVAQLWAGGKFGAQFIPRVGSEVLVSFMYGHPDYPFVISPAYNGQNELPFNLPGDKNECGFVTRSTAKGDVSDGHRLSFNDKKGEERLTIIAQKDLSLTVKNDATTIIAANRSTELTKGNERLTVKEGDMNITLNKGNWQHNVTGNASTRLKDGNYDLEVTGGGGSIKADKALTLESTESITLKVGNNTLTISTSGITLSNSTESIELQNSVISIKSEGSAEITSKNLEMTGNIETKISGNMILIG